jgi:hypothetical protein
MQLTRPGKMFNWKNALGELSLIVAGVLIALAADSWWDNRSASQRERVYLQQLLSDVRETENRLEYSIAGDSTILARVLRFLSVIDTATVAPHADSINAWAIVDYRSFQPLTGTYDALVQSGNLRMVSSDSLRLHLMSYAADIAVVREWLRHTETLIWRNLERMDLAFLEHILMPSGEKLWRGSSLDVDAFLRDPELVNTVNMQRTASAERVTALRRLREPTYTLRRMVEAEINGR